MKIFAVALLAAMVLAPTASADHVRDGAIRWACGFNGSGDRGHPDGCGIDPVGGGSAVGEDGPATWGPSWISSSDLVLGVAIGDQAVALPVKMMDAHEIANFELGGTPVSVTYCPLCGSGITFDRRIDGDTLAFTASGFLYRSDLVMWDDVRGILWNQIRGEAIATLVDGRVQTDHPELRLERIPTLVLPWADWKAQHPDSPMLQPVRDRYAEPYASYKKDGDRCGLGGCSTVGDTLHPKEMVIGVEADPPVAFPVAAAQRQEVAVHNTSAGQVIVGFTAPGLWRVFDAGDHRFVQTAEGWQDQQGRIWDLTTGTHGSDALSELDGLQLFWFAWEEHHPETTVWLPADAPAAPSHTDDGRLPGFTIPIVVAFLVVAGAWWRWRK